MALDKRGCELAAAHAAGGGAACGITDVCSVCSSYHCYLDLDHCYPMRGAYNLAQTAGTCLCSTCASFSRTYSVLSPCEKQVIQAYALCMTTRSAQGDAIPVGAVASSMETSNPTEAPMETKRTLFPGPAASSVTLEPGMGD